MPGEQLLEVGRVVLRLALGERAPEHPEHRRALEQAEVDRQFRDASAGKTHHQQAAVPGDAANGLVEQVAADRVVDHVHTLAAGQALHFVLQAGFAVVDQLIGTCGLGHGQFLCAAGGGDHLGAHGLADFHRGQTDAAGGAEDQQGFARLQVGALLEGVHRGAVGHAEGGRAVEVHAGRNRHNVVTRHRHLFGKAAPAGQGHDPVTDFDMGDFFADRRHYAGCFAARRKREGRLELILAFDDQGVREVDPGGMHVQHDLGFLHLRAGNVFQHQGFGRAEGFAQHGFHGATPLVVMVAQCRQRWSVVNEHGRL